MKHILYCPTCDRQVAYNDARLVANYETGKGEAYCKKDHKMMWGGGRTVKQMREDFRKGAGD
jgi:hypothetical protein